MSIYDDAREAERKLSKAAMNTDKEVRSDIGDLRDNMNDVGRNIKSISQEKAEIAGGYLREIVAELKTSGTKTLRKAEARIRQEPGQSIGIAFAAGLLASVLLRHRKS